MLTHANSNATAESINADIQSAIARARGFRTFHNLRTIIISAQGPTRPAGFTLRASDSIVADQMPPHETS
jgi:hypothetical protein